MRLAWILPDLGHYHLARLGALAALPDTWVVALLVLDRGGFAAFNAAAPAPADGRLSLSTLFPAHEAARLSLATLRRRLEAALDRAHCDAVFVCGWSQRSAHLVQRWALRRGVAMVMVSDSHRLPPGHGRHLDWLKRRLLAVCGAAFVAGTPHRDYLVALGMEPARIGIGCDVVDNAHFRRGAENARATAAATRARLHLPPRYFLCAGRLIPEKDPLLVLAAYAGLRTECRSVPDLVFAGDGPLRPTLAHAIGSAGLQRSVHLYGFVSYADLPAVYGLARATVLASRRETWGLVVNEAMASGSSVIVSAACGCASDLVATTGAGWVFPPGDQAALADVLARLAHDPAPTPPPDRAAVTQIARWSPGAFARTARTLAATAIAAGPAGTPRARALAALLLPVLARLQRFT